MTVTDWRKSSYSEGANNCVEVDYRGLVRDSKNPAPVLRADLAALLGAVKTGRLTH